MTHFVPLPVRIGRDSRWSVRRTRGLSDPGSRCARAAHILPAADGERWYGRSSPGRCVPSVTDVWTAGAAGSWTAR